MFLFRFFAVTWSLLVVSAALCAQASAVHRVADIAPGSGTHLATPAPIRTPKPTPKPPPIPAPSHVRPVQSKQDCASALSLLAALCDASVRAGMLQLVWRDDATKLDGYKVYRIEGDHHRLLQTLSNGVSPRYVAIAKPSGGYDHTCYAVSAYLGQRESALSPAYCAGAGATASTVTFTPAHSRSYLTLSYPILYNPRAIGGTLPWSTLLTWMPSTFQATIPSQVTKFGQNASVNGTAYVGYAYVQVLEPTAPPLLLHVNGTNQGYVKVNSRGGYQFDLGKLNKHAIYEATLTLDVSQSLQPHANKYIAGLVASDYSCADHYLIGRDFWWSQNLALNNASAGGDINPGPGPRVSADVTKTVARWAAGEFNYGFIFSAVAAAPEGLADRACFTKYYTAHLKVIYF